MRRRWVVMMCWASPTGTSVMVPQPTKYRFWTRRRAQSLANRLTLGMRDGRWYEVQLIDGPGGGE